MSVERYLSASSLAYVNLESYKGWTVGQLYDQSGPHKGPLKDDFINKTENRHLKSLSNWTLINAETYSSGMSAIALQNPDTKEVVFAL